MKWFKHFSNAHDNNKLTKVRMKYGADGYAIYWYCLELISGDLGQSEKINFDLAHDAEVIGFNLKVDTLRVEEIMKFMVNLGLFEDIQGTISCLKLAKYLEKKTTRNATIHKIIDAATSGNVADNPRQSPDKPPNVPDCPETSPLDTDTDTEYKKHPHFLTFWNAYPRKQNKKQAFKKWQKLNPSQELVLRMLENIRLRLEMRNWSLAEKKFIPHPDVYLNQERWNDEVLKGGSGVDLIENGYDQSLVS